MSRECVCQRLSARIPLHVSATFPYVKEVRGEASSDYCGPIQPFALGGQTKEAKNIPTPLTLMLK